ncbi:hypothetical protein TeGR_g9543 [Tetraparma gracilis]|uniref:Uncharacterized protein n=1 Tax=Tetraparma gracilis TaxID=2962635 RepID=A0ABQ6MT16_9STRA|nr:hypothetical protein TeGR_g9543 [Tetraparma gracilis]
MPREKIVLSIGPLGSAVAAHSAHIQSLTHSSSSSSSSSSAPTPYDPDSSFRPLLSLAAAKAADHCPSYRGLLLDEKASFLSFHASGSVAAEAADAAAAAGAWGGQVDVFGDTSDGSYGGFREALRGEVRARTFDFEEQRRQQERAAAQAERIPAGKGGRGVDWDAYLTPEAPSAAAALQLSPAPPPPPADGASRALAACGGARNIRGWRDFWPASLPSLLPLPVWDLRADAKEAYAADFGSEFMLDVFEEVRVLLEECDAVASFTFETTHDPQVAYWSRLAVDIAEEMRQECRSAASVAAVVSGRCRSEKDIRAEQGDDSDASRGRRMRGVFRESLNAGLALQGLCGSMDLVLPLGLAECERLMGDEPLPAPNPRPSPCSFLSPEPASSLFASAAAAALALDSALSPTMLKDAHECGGVAVAGSGVASGTEVFAKRVPAQDYAAVLRPTQGHRVLELDAKFMGQGQLRDAVSETHEMMGQADRRQGGAKKKVRGEKVRRARGRARVRPSGLAGGVSGGPPTARDSARFRRR